MAGLSVREAAQRLDLNPSRVRALLKEGGLTGRRVGSQWVVDDDSVTRRLDMAASARGRPLSRRSAWGAAALSDGQATPWLASSERSRLRTRLAGHAADGVDVYRWWMRKRASVARYRIADADIAELLADSAVVAGGISAAAPYDLGLSFADEAEVYVGSSEVGRLVDEFFLVGSGRGNLVLHVEDSGSDWHQRTARVVDGVSAVPRLVAAVDLLDSDDTRTRSAGTRLLGTLLRLVAGGLGPRD
ncbi:helix-turn-helix domain-containing protein [Saccharothrix sp. NRRL B-16314]|uniref:helix-turn-helix domain-containing protein n=1 Tax=Saccharothrix sp. NRRL B-16314 TaxID=1463825 RepID=UPI0012DE8033|nr:helix-turn-helix domain-containing protein [Saccharothrix sp. NRRL B-16314]